jgi:serine/threonine protein kinase
MKGAGFISSGSYGCVNSPPLQCQDDKDRNKKYYRGSVGKYFGDTTYANDEYHIQEIVKKVDPKYTWTLPLLKKCTISHPKKVDEADKCEYYNEDDDKKYMQLIYKKGGVDLLHLLDSYFGKSVKAKRDIFIKIFKLLKPILYGLKALNEEGYCHLDIKPENILFDGKRLSVIDFGLLSKSDKIFVDGNEKYLLFDYPFYPPEFKLYGSYLLKKGKIPNLVTFKSLWMKTMERDTKGKSVRYDLNMQIERYYKLLAYNTINFTKPRKVEEEFLKYVNKIDIYSLGITLYDMYSYLVLEDNLVTYSIKIFILEMINLNPYERMNWENILKEYEKLINLIGNFK